MPSAVFHDTTTALDTVPDSTASKLAAVPSATLRVAGSRDTVTEAPIGSDSTTLAASGAPTDTSPLVVLAPLRVTRSVSSGSRTVSAVVAMVIAAVAWPEATVRLPEGAV